MFVLYKFIWVPSIVTYLSEIKLKITKKINQEISLLQCNPYLFNYVINLKTLLRINIWRKKIVFSNTCKPTLELSIYNKLDAIN